MDALQSYVTLTLVVAWGIAAGILLFVKYLRSTDRDSPKLRAVCVVLMTYSIAAWTVICLICIPYMKGLAPTISRHNDFVPLQQAGAGFSLFFHTALSVFLVATGTWFAIRIWRQRNKP